ncbi:MAG: acetyl-CoA carboxylase biotin carboxyl carrier protein subunit [Anaerolineae bacterium]|nr:acetyl-CoA carboxylase biotin carboxyl carrier protein subunit [Anaerolineales bacterium]MCQ3974429.1 acetyl-CoA carboxylase biotin carboxyl carrier protein subunit [Anaerolineae bacterium]
MMNGNVLSSRRVKVTVNGKGYLVEVLGSLTSSPVTVNVNGQPYVVDVEPADTIAKPTAASATALDTVVRETAAPPKAPTPTAPAGPSVPHLKAPMPGNIIEIKTQPGDRVKYGQPLMTLEAMKMKNAVRSPRDGVVATVEVSQGETVGHGQILVTFQVEGA